MGLDMYLSGKKYMSKYFDAEDTGRIAKVNEVFGVVGEEDGDYGAQEVTFRVAYWHKANAIHKWFVDKCQGGVDECQETYVDREQLKELSETCKTVLADMSKAEELLPSESGFFFGSTDYDEWYFKDLEYTATEIEKLLSIEKPEGRGYYPWSYVYHSSW